MRVAHLNFVPTGLASVVKKLGQQARSARLSGLPMDFLLVNDDEEGPGGDVLHCRYARPSGYRRRLLREHTFHKTALIEQAVRLADYDAVVMRYIGHYTRAGGFLRRHGGKLITEHHTKELAQIYLYRGGLARHAFALVERLSAARFLRRVRGIIGVTDEIRRHELELAGPKPSTVIGNGILVAETPFTGFRPFDGRELHLVFVANDFPPWQGLDRLVDGLAAFGGPERLVLHLVGRVYPEVEARIVQTRLPHAEVQLHGRLHGVELDRVMEQATLGVSSLGLYTNQMTEACTLKSREYAARGLPFVMGYTDPDMPVGTPFVLEVSNSPSPVGCRQVVEFARRITASADIARSAREFAEKNLDWRPKLQRLHTFASQVVATPLA